MADKKKKQQSSGTAAAKGKSNPANKKNDAGSKKSTGKSTIAENTSYKNSSASVRFLLAALCMIAFLIQIILIFQPEGALLLFFRNILMGLIGEVGYYAIMVAFPYLAWVLVAGKKYNISMRCSATLLFVVVFGMSLQLTFQEETYENVFAAVMMLFQGGIAGTSAGLICGALGIGLRMFCGDIFSYIVLIILAVILLLRAMEITISGLFRAIENRPRDIDDIEDDEEDEVYDPAAVLVNRLADKRIEQKRKRRQQRLDAAYEVEYVSDSDQERALPAAMNAGKPSTSRNILNYLDGEGTHSRSSNPQTTSEKSKTESRIRQPEQDISAPVYPAGGKSGQEAGHTKADHEPSSPISKPIFVSADEDDDPIPDSMPPYQPDAPIPAAPKTESRGGDATEKVTAKQARDSAKQVEKEIEKGKAAAKTEYCFPPINLLTLPPRSNTNGTDEMRENSRRLNETLASFRIDAHIVNVTRGPSVTRYEVELDKGVRLSKLTSCADDIALSLGASGVRIAAVPGKISVVGIEVPNRTITMVPLREVIDSSEFANSKSKSSFAVGKDIGGSCIIGNIAKMPHMLIAGTTGSGKSVCMNSIIISLLYKASPEDVKLIMVDPKMVELANYNGIPHLMIPVVTDPKKAAGALQWAVNEMMRRYAAMSDAGVRDLESYNTIITAEGGEKLPQLIVIIDELADLMMVAAKEVEDSICRIAQMGRASGVHLIIATQRPSADVITGLMKANIPSRIAFSVASAMESRIILDTQGAEKLVGKGDMLFAPIGCGKPLRVQGCFVTDAEVIAVTSYVKENYVADYDQTVMEDIDRKAQQTGKKSSGGSSYDPEPNTDELDGDELLPAAVDVVLETGQASVSMLQRRLKLGYARAARIVDEMEEKGIVGPFQGAKSRNILITKEQWAQMQSGGSSQLSFDDSGDFGGVPEDF